MRHKFIAKSALTIFVVAFFVACSAKQDDGLYGLSPDAWYEQILEDIKSSDLENADKHYTSFSSEHVRSPLLEQMLLILAQAHARNEEYILANYYLDEYIKKYGDGGSKTEFAEFLKIKANFDSFTQPDRNQKLIEDSIAGIERFIYMYPNTQFRPLIETMLVKFKLANYFLQEQIKSLYERTGREISADIYTQRLENSPMKDADMIAPDLPWYRKIFE
ncbi:outer membrane protein assembly factor BamD [Campylobacter sp. 19-13652]|uniref:outer membrane protein assembly factor BamD n=1 Tax=Campylobacter sp. 19-13652 TaxID=2840180 RepID=UPI001C789150|nr:outer membrane protein assembly factor BamD [Campylobacter sp. 19-13652]BCX79644.1 outer membrane protein assembly factor BamD [Campylobacter sp. 19-13652]